MEFAEEQDANSMPNKKKKRGWAPRSNYPPFESSKGESQVAWTPRMGKFSANE
jgi:hypothetical protein